MYSEPQRRLIAYYLARNGLNVAHAVAALREHEESFAELGERTLRRMLADPVFQSMLADVSASVREEQDKALREAEHDRIRSELSGTVAEHLSAMAEEDRRMFAELRRAFDSPDVSRQEKFKFWQRLHEFVQTQRARYAGTLGESWQAQLFVECMAEAFTRVAGAEIAGKGLHLANKLYQERAAARSQTEGTSGQGPGTEGQKSHNVAPLESIAVAAADPPIGNLKSKTENPQEAANASASPP